MIKNLLDYSNPKSFASKIRAKRIRVLSTLIEKLASNKPCFRILDVGGTQAYWNIFPSELMEKHNIQITLLNLPGSLIQSTSARFSMVSGDACEMAEIPDHEFDLVHSNSVIEHVGGWSQMKKMASEIDRVGNAYYLQTPYFWFPIEPHFVAPILHWLPMPVRCSLAMKMSLGNWPRAQSLDEAMQAQQSAILLDRKMMQSLFPGAALQFERFAGLPKSVIAIKT